MQNDSLLKMKEQLEHMFLRVLVSKLKKQTMHAADIQPISQKFLGIEPFASVEDAHAKVGQFVSEHPDFQILKEYADVYSDEENLDQKLKAMRDHLKANNVDEALKVVNQ